MADFANMIGAFVDSVDENTGSFDFDDLESALWLDSPVEEIVVVTVGVGVNCTFGFHPYCRAGKRSVAADMHAVGDQHLEA